MAQLDVVNGAGVAPVDLSDLEIDGCSRSIGENGIEVYFEDGPTVRFPTPDSDAQELFAEHDRSGFVDYALLESLLAEGKLGPPSFTSDQTQWDQHEIPFAQLSAAVAEETVESTLVALECALEVAPSSSPYFDVPSFKSTVRYALEVTQLTLQAQLDRFEDFEPETLDEKRKFCHELTEALQACHCRLVSPSGKLASLIVVGGAGDRGYFRWHNQDRTTELAGPKIPALQLDWAPRVRNDNSK